MAGVDVDDGEGDLAEERLAAQVHEKVVESLPMDQSIGDLGNWCRTRG